MKKRTLSQRDWVPKSREITREVSGKYTKLALRDYSCSLKQDRGGVFCASEMKQ